MSISANEIKKVRSLSEKKFRDRLGLFCVEGEKMVEEAMNSRFKVETVYRKDEIGEESMSRISSLASPSPVLAVLHKPQDINLFTESSLSDALGKSGLYLALDTIRDPGNLGTILRIADWFGIDAVFAAPDTVDVFNPKVVQATMGAIFRVKFHYVDIPTLCKAAVSVGGNVYGTFLDGSDMYAKDLNPGKDSPSVIVGDGYPPYNRFLHVLDLQKKKLVESVNLNDLKYEPEGVAVNGKWLYMVMHVSRQPRNGQIYRFRIK